MERGWKPGDVVSLRIVDGPPRVAMRLGAEAAGWAVVRDGGVVFYYDNQRRGIRTPEIRPLVVIDPEEPGVLAASFRQAISVASGAHTDWDVFATLVLEALVPKPPKPEEPKTKAALVRDFDGAIWARQCTSTDKDMTYPWVRVANGRKPGSERRDFTWSDIDAVEVLSQGVTP